MGKQQAEGGQEYPKYLDEFDVIVQSKAEHDALLAGKASVRVVKSEQGDLRSVVLK